MKNFNKFIVEEKDDELSTDTKKTVINFITANLYRFINSPEEKDTKSLLMLIAALSVLNTDQPEALQTARRIAQMALVRAGKKKVK